MLVHVLKRIAKHFFSDHELFLLKRERERERERERAKTSKMRYQFILMKLSTHSGLAHDSSRSRDSGRNGGLNGLSASAVSLVILIENLCKFVKLIFGRILNFVDRKIDRLQLRIMSSLLFKPILFSRSNRVMSGLIKFSSGQQNICQ